jgi:hypothetical protein
MRIGLSAARDVVVTMINVSSITTFVDFYRLRVAYVSIFHRAVRLNTID